jgi:hypothetical protein
VACCAFNCVWIDSHLVPWDLTRTRVYAGVVHGVTDALLARLPRICEKRSTFPRGLEMPDITWVLNRFIVWEIA